MFSYKNRKISGIFSDRFINNISLHNSCENQPRKNIRENQHKREKNHPK
jgi:hypothetical protein